MAGWMGLDALYHLHYPSKWKMKKRREKKVEQRQKVWQTQILSLTLLPMCSPWYPVPDASCLLHCVPSPTHWHIAIDHPHSFKHFHPPCTKSFCKADEVPTTVIGHVVGGSTFWAMHILLHQLWGLTDPSQPPSSAEVPAPGDGGVTAAVGLWLREAQAARLLQDVASTLLPWQCTCGRKYGRKARKKPLYWECTVR